MTTLTTPAPILDARGGLPHTYRVHTLGCQMNVHDSEHMAGLLERTGYLHVKGVPKTASRAADAGDGGADVVTINTCPAHENAATQFFSNLSQLAAVRHERPGMQITVAGYLAQQMREGIVKRAPWVNVVFDTRNFDVLPALLEHARHSSTATVELEESLKVFPSALPTRHKSSYVAQVSIAMGCSNTCTFYIMPSLHGKRRDRRPGDILAEVKAVAARGTTETTLLGQNANSYGVGFGDHGVFAKLLRAAGSVEGIERVRFTGPHPAAFTDSVIEAVATTEAVVPSLYMLLRSDSDRVLCAIHRSYRTQRFLGILDKVRAIIPEATITTDITVGFPGETEEDFRAVLDIVEQTRFASIYTFKYSPCPGTPVADRGDRVPTEVVKDRYRRLGTLVRHIAHEKNERQEGHVVGMLIAKSEGRRGMVTARISEHAANNHLIHVALPEGLAEDDYADETPHPGDMVTVRITHDAPYNLIADSARYRRELDPRAAATNEALRPGDRLWLNDGPAPFQIRHTRAGDARERR